MSDKIILIGNLRNDKWASFHRGRIYSTKGIVPCLVLGSGVNGGGNEPKFLIEHV